MNTLNSIQVLLSNTFCRLAIWKRPASAAAVALGYGYDIEDDED